MKRIRGSTGESTSVIQSALDEQFRILAHNLTSDWGLIHCSMAMLHQEPLPPADHEVYKDICSQATRRLQQTVAQLTVQWGQLALVGAISSLLSQLQAQPSIPVMEQLTPLLAELKKILNQTMNTE